MVEFLIATTILTVIIGATVSIQASSTGLMRDSVARSVLEEKSAFAIREIAFHVRWADGAPPSSPAPRRTGPTGSISACRSTT